MDRADGLSERQRTVGTNDGGMPPFGVDQRNAGRHQSPFQQRRKRYAGRLARCHERSERRFRQRFRFGDTPLGGAGIAGVALNADKPPPQLAGDRSSRAGSAKRVEYKIVGLRCGEDRAGQECFRLLRRMQFLAVRPLEPFFPGAQRNEPIGTHLNIVVAGFKRLVIECVAPSARVARRPDQGLMSVGKTATAEIRHRVRLAPDDVVQNPEAEVLEKRADPENVVV